MALRTNMLPAIMRASDTATWAAMRKMAQPAASNGRSSRASDGGRQRGAGTLNGRREPEQDAGENRDGKDIGKYSKVRVYVEDQRAIFDRQSFGGLGYR